MISQQTKTTNKPLVPKVIGGAGSSGGSGGGGKEADDNLESTATLSIVELLGEGQIGGLVNNSPSSIFLNDTPLANSSGIYNFNNVKWAFVDGTQSQESLGDGYNEVENSYSINSKVTKESPVKFTITDPNADKVRAIVSVPVLMKSDNKGNINGTHVEFRFSISLNNGPFVHIGNGKITGKTRTKYQREYSYELPKTTEDGKKVSMWTIQVERMTVDSSSSSVNNDLFVDNYSVITSSRLRYPNSAIVGISFDAEQFTGVPSRSYLVDGLLIKVPSNRDNKTRQYTGNWDGTFKLAVCDNPAWILYDLLTNKRYGLGNYVPVEYANPARLYVIGKYCDQLVDDGFGKQEPRFTLNTCINTRMDAHQLVSEISSVFNGMTYWTGNEMGYMCDMPAPVTMRYTAANVVDGEFMYAGAQRKDIHSTVLVTWNDPENNYQPATEYVSDPEMVERFGIRPAEITAFGCTSRAQAVRVGRWMLHTERYQSKTISFKVGIDSAFVMPGDVIEIVDPDRAGQRQGGRIVKCTKTSAVLDGVIEFEKGSNISIRLADGKFADRLIESVSAEPSGTSIVTWKTPLTTLPVANALWVIKSPKLSPLSARVVAVGQGENPGEYSITSIQHNESKFDHIEKDMMLEMPNITVIDPNLIAAPTSVEIKNESRIEQSLAVRNMVISWNQVKEAIGYEVVYRKGDGNWFTLPVTKMPLVEIENVQQGTYTAKVIAISATGGKSPPAWSVPTEIDGQVAVLPKLAWLKATPAMFSIELTWSHRTNTTGVAYTEIEVSEDDGVKFKALTVIPDPAKEYVHTGLALGNKRTYRARLVDTYGFKSEWSDLVSASPDTDPSKVLEVLEDQIGIKELDTVVTESIDAAAKEAKDAAKSAKDANEKAAKETKDRIEAMAAEKKAVAEAIAAEKKANAEQFAKESRDRSNAIKDAATKEANDRNAAIKVETDARLSEVKKLQDGITKETQERKTETGNLLKNVETFKSSTNNTLASIQDKTTANTTDISAQAQRINGIDSRLKNTDKTATDAREAAATAQTTANTAVSKAEANATKISSVDASLSTTTEAANSAALLSKYQSAGKPMSDDPSFKTGNGNIGIYNNGTRNGSFERVLKQSDNPTDSTHEMVRTVVNTMGTGIGWVFSSMVAAANRVYLVKQIVKLPVGFKLDLRSNSIGSGGNSLRWLTSQLGTGKYETYWSIAICGENGPFSTTGHIALTALSGTPQPTPENPLVAYLASYEWWDCTAVNDTIPKAWRDEVAANAKATSGIEARVTDAEGVIKSQSKSFEQLKNDLTITNDKVDKKAESSALSETKSAVQKQGEELLAQSGKIDSLSAAISTSAPEYRFTATIDALDNLSTVHPDGKQKVKLIDEPSAVSGKVMRVGTNSGDDSVILISDTFVPIDPDKLYRIRYRYRRVQGDGTTWLSLVCSNADKTANISATNSNAAIWDISNSNYFASNMAPKLGEWATGEVFAKGKSLGGVGGTWSKTSPRNFPAKAAFFRLGFLPNYAKKSGIQDFDYVVIEDYDAMAANESTSDYVKTVETSVKNIGGKVESNSNLIERMTGQVKQLEDGVSKKADTEILKNYSTKTETDQAVAKGLESFNASLSIGGGNILANGDVVKNFGRWSSYGTVSHKDPDRTQTRIVTLGFNRDSLAQGIITQARTKIKPETDYVISFLARTNDGSIACGYNYFLGYDGLANQGSMGSFTVNSAEWKRYEISYKTRATANGEYQLLLGSNGAGINGKSIEFAELQIQEGSKATSWSKPLSTLQDSLDANASAIESTQAEVKNVDGKVSAQASQMNALKGEISAVDTKAGQAIKNAATAQTTANTAVSQNAVNATNIAELNANLNNMSIGGQNLWSVVDKPLINEHGIGLKTVINSQDEHYRITMKSFSAANSLILSRHDSVLEDAKHNIENDQEYVYSFEIRANKPGLIHTVYAYFGSMRSVVSSNHKIGEEWTKFSFPFKASGTGTGTTNQLQGFAFSSNPNHGWKVDDWYEVRHVQMQKGNKATEYAKATGSILKELDANAKAIESTNADVKKVGQDVTSQSGKITALENNLTTTNGEVKKKADSTAVNAIGSEVKKIGESINSQANSIQKLEASYSSRDSDSLIPDYNLANPDCWTSHYGHDLAPFFKKTGSGKVTNTVVRKQAGDSSIFFNYSKTPLPLDKAYKVGFWVRRSADSDGLLYINGMYGKKDGTFSPASYYSNIISLSSVPANETWVYVERAIDLRATADTNPQIKFGFGLGHTGTKGWWELQGYSVKAILSEGDVDGTLATAKALSETNSAVKKTENAIDSLSKSTTILQNNIAVSGKAGANLLIESNKEITYKAGAYPHGVYSLGVDWEVGATYTLIWCAEHKRGSGDTNSTLAPYAGGGSQTIQQIVNAGKAVRSVTFVKNGNGIGRVINFYMINRPTAAMNSVGTVYWAVLVKGNLTTTDEWIPSQFDYFPSINATSEAIKNVESQVKVVDSKVTVTNKSVEQLTGKLETVESGLKTKADASALAERYTKTETDKAIAGKVESYDASLKIGGVNVVADSEREKNSAAPSNREYFMYERSKELQEFYNENLNKPITISFEMSVPVAGGVQVYSSNQSAHNFSASVSAKVANKFEKYVVTVNPVPHNTTPNNASGSTIEFYGTYNTGRIPTIRKLQIEAGTKATDWSQSPRDSREAMAKLTELINVSVTENNSMAEKITQIESSFHPQSPGGRMPDFRDETKKDMWTFILVKMRDGDVFNRQFYFKDINTSEMIRKGETKSATAVGNGTFFNENRAIMLYRTYVYVKAAKTVKFSTIRIDDTACIYVNNGLQFHKMGYGDYTDCSLILRQGWNRLDVFIANGASHGGFFMTPSLESQVDQMCPAKLDRIMDTTTASVLNDYSTTAEMNSAIATATTSLESKIDKSTDDKVAQAQGKTHLLDLSKLNTETYYPVTVALNSGGNKRQKFTLIRFLGEHPENKVTWSTHNTKTFSVELTWETAANGWGANQEDRKILSSQFMWTAWSPVLGPEQMVRSSEEVFYLRGGAIYRLICDPKLAPTIRTAPYTQHEITVQPIKYNAAMTPQADVNQLRVRLTEQSQVIDGVKAIKTVTVDNNGMISGWGLTSELINGKVNSTIGFRADQIYFQSPADGRKPFIFLTEPKEISGVVYPAGAWIDSAYIATASIKLAHIDRASIGSLSALSATIGTLRTRDHGSRLEIRDNILEVFDDNGQVRVQLGVLY